MSQSSFDTTRYFQYSTFGFGRYVDKLLIRIRNQSYERFISKINANRETTILDVGVSQDDHPSSNFLEKKYEWKKNITGVSIDD